MAVSLVVHAFPLVVLMLATAVLYSLRAVVYKPNSVSYFPTAVSERAFASLHAVAAGVVLPANSVIKSATTTC